MDDVREKLVELLNQIIDSGFKQPSHLYESIEQLSTSEIAAHLIANGVTVQQWIPVIERLPEEFVWVLTYMQSLDGKHNRMELDYIFTSHNGKEWAKNHKMWQTKVSHWMPLPEPPNGGVNE